MSTIKKYNFIIVIIGMIFSCIATITLFPKIKNGAISINIEKDSSFLLYYGSLLILYGGILWDSTIKKFDYGLKIDFSGYSERSIALLFASTMSPMLMLVFGTFDSFGGQVATIIWVITLAYIFLRIFLKNNHIYQLSGKYVIFILSLTFLVISIILLDQDPFIWLGISYVVGNLFYIFSFLIYYNIIKIKFADYLFPLLFLVGTIIIYLGNILVLFNAY